MAQLVAATTSSLAFEVVAPANSNTSSSSLEAQPLMALDLDYHHERSEYSYREASAILSEDEFQGISSEGS